jgi:PTS system nitrogen regulatory IIA component
MELADILAEDAVLDCTGVTSKRQLFDILSEKAADITGMDRNDILGNGIAIPHGKLNGLKGVTAVFARLDTPIDFDAVDDQPVDVVIMLLAPVGAGADHLKALSRVARLLRTESVIDQLRRETDVKRLYALLITPLEDSCAA